MDVLVNVVGQKLKMTTNLKNLISGTQEFVQFVFNFQGGWEGLTTFAQFIQNGTAYNIYLDSENKCYLPPEIGEGTCTLMLYGTKSYTVGTGNNAVTHTVHATTNYLTLTIDDNILVQNANSTQISRSLYDQLVASIETVSAWSTQAPAELAAEDVRLAGLISTLQTQVGAKAANSALTAEIARAQAAEQALATSKAAQSDVTALQIRMTQLENNEVVQTLIEDAVSEELANYLSSGTLSNLTIANGSITRAKVNTAFEATLAKADTAMQPSIYDQQGLEVDVYAYAVARKAEVQANLNTLIDEVHNAYQLSNNLVYTNLHDSLMGVLSLARSYTDAALVTYESFTVTVVDTLPVAGQARTFYLVPKSTGEGYDKYWWVTDDGVSKWDTFGSSSTVVVDSLSDVTTPDEDVDYIVDTGSGCLYYKYIDNTWKIVAGSIAHVSATLPSVASGNAYTDYYVLDGSTYVHYRFINGAYQVIGGNSYSKSQVDALISAVNASITTTNTNVATNAAGLTTLNNTVTSLQQSLANLDVEGLEYYATFGTAEIDGVSTSNVFSLHEVDGSTDSIVSQFVIQGGSGSGSGGSTTTSTLTVEKVTASPLIVTPSDTVNITVSYSSEDSDGADLDGTYVWKQGNTVIMSGSMQQGNNTFDFTDYVSVGTQKFTLTVTDEAGSSVTKSWQVQKVDVRLETTFSDKIAYTAGNTVNFTYIPYGSISKTVNFKLDGVTLQSVTTSASGTLQSYTIPAQTHGAHLLEVWVTATINNATVSTPHIYKDIVFVNSSSTTPIISCPYRYDYHGQVAATQYNATNIEYSVFHPSTSTPTVTYKVGTSVVSTETLTSSNAVWSYKTAEIGLKSLKITCGTTEVEVRVNVAELDIDVDPVTGGLAFDFNPTGLSNSSANRLWSDSTDSTINMTVSNNFDWSNGGYKLDANGDQYFCVKAGTTATFNYNLFERDAKVYGAEFKMIFKTENVKNASATFLTCLHTTYTYSELTTPPSTSELSSLYELVNGSHVLTEDTSVTSGKTYYRVIPTPVGLQMNVHEAYLKSSADSLYIPYSEEDIIEFEYNINELDTEDENATAIIMSYEDGVGFRPMLYDSTHRLYQYTPAPITVGSADCDVHIYRMKAYENALTDSDILANFIADSRNSDTMIARYDRNQIYNENNALDPETLAEACPDLRIIKIECPHFTNDKKDYVKNTSVECIYKNGDATLDNWKFTNGYHAGQGTTSNEYGYAGRNIDVIMCADGENQIIDKIPLDTTYISQLRLGDGTTFLDGSGKVSLTRTSVPNNWFNIKVNIASSENANNALLQKRYNRYLPYKSLATQANSKVKNDMEFVNCVIFIKENDPDLTQHREFNDTNWHFYAIGNIGDSKKTDATRVNDVTDLKEFVIEVSDNALPNSTFQTGVYNNGVEVFPITQQQWSGYDGYTEVTQSKHLIAANLPLFYETSGDTKVPTTDTSIVAGKQYYMRNYTNEKYKNLYLDMYEFNSATNKTSQIYGWDLSVEFRYDMGGETKDGASLATTAAKEAQRLRNKQIWREMYEWVITSSNSDFVSQFEGWFIKDSALYWYLFTERYTMTDNRAKNTFWHFGKTGVYHAVPNPKTQFIDMYCEYNSTNETYSPTSDTTVNANKTYYWQYAFELWDYDNDTALGINNSGELTMTYGKEDIDYQIDGVASSGYVFNGAESVFWKRVRTLMHSQLATMFISRESEGCWSSTSLINEFDEWQAQFPEELWRLDIQRKYYRTYLGSSVDNSFTGSATNRFLSSMLNGRKKYQRRQFERDQEAYMATKYVGNTATADQIMFRCNTPTVGATDSPLAVEPDYTLSITPYSDMYLSIKFGNAAEVTQVRAKAGQTYTINCPLSGTLYDTAFLIYCASKIQALNDLSACYIHDNDFSKATKLQTLKIGDDTYKKVTDSARLIDANLSDFYELNTTTGVYSKTTDTLIDTVNKEYYVRYSNPFLTTLTIGSNKLLSSLNIRNCPNLVGSVNLSNCSNLATFLAEGTAITGVIFASNGKIATAHLPSTVNSLTMRYLAYLTDLQVTLTALESLTIEHCSSTAINEKTMVQTAINNLQSLRLAGINWTLADTTLLNSIHAMSSSYLAGAVYVSGQIRQSEITKFATAWSDLALTYDAQSVVPQYLVTFYNADETTVLYQTYVDRGSTATNPVTAGLISTPTKSADAQYTYTFSGWSGISDAILSETAIVAQYATTTRTYTVTWYARAGVSLGSVQAQYGDDVTYNGTIPTNTTGESTYVYNVFAGWNKSTGYIRENTDVYAIWQTAQLPSATNTPDLSEMTPAQIFATAKGGKVIDYISTKDYFDMRMGNDFDFQNVDSTLLVGTGKRTKNDTSNLGGVCKNGYDLVLDGTSANVKETDIQLFTGTDNGFVIAIDFTFSDTSSSATNCSLVSCYEPNGTEGFRLRYSGAPNVQWGDVNTPCGYGMNRDMVVIRKKAGSNKLYVYSSNAYSDANNFSNSLTTVEITRTRSTSTIAKLTLGANRYSDSTTNVANGSYENLAKGVVHWAKIWFDDLGESNCKSLAYWCHELMRMEYTGTITTSYTEHGRYRVVGGGGSYCNASFLSNNLFANRTHVMNPTSTNVGGWESCKFREFYKDKMYYGIPQVWRSIIKQVQINASAGNRSTEVVISNDYVYLPSTYEIRGYSGAPYTSEGEIISWFGVANNSRGALTANASRIKFKGFIVSDDATYYNGTTEPSTITSNDVQVGDVWCYNGGNGFIYVDAATVSALGITPSYNAAIGGGWIAAPCWWLRSPYVGNSYDFWHVNTNGGCGGSYANNSYGCALGFSI